MGQVMKRAADIARAAQQQRVAAVAERLTAIFGSGAVEVEEARLLVRGSGLIKRWLIDPELRFLSGAGK
ncbi:MAG: hypothetical protein ABIO80_09215 [Sphingomicrobium sp.]